MADTNGRSVPPQRRRRWPKIIGVIFLVLVALLVAAYFVGTSAPFFKGVILPRASKQVNANITVSDAKISPFKQVVLRDLKVQPIGAETLLTAPEVRARYSLMDIIRGNIHVEEVVLVSPAITLVENADGTKNTDPLLKKPEAPREKKAPAGKEEKAPKPPQLDIGKIIMSSATIRQTKNYKGNFRDETELSNVNLEITDVKNGQAGKLLLTATAKVVNNPPAPATNGSIQAKLNANAVFSLTGDLKPASVKGNARVEVAQAAGSFADANGLAVDLDSETTPAEIKQLALRFQRGNAKLGELTVSGPFDIQKLEGKVNVEVRSIDKQVLNFIGAKSGVDFGTTKINSTNQIELTKAGDVISASGQFDAAQLQLTRTNQTTPTLDLAARYNVTVDRKAQTALLRQLTLTGTQKQSQLLQAELTSPMNLSWGAVSNAVGDSALNLTVNHLNIPDWKPFVGDAVSSGVVDVKAKLLSQEGGKKLSFDVNSKIDNLTAGSGSNQITQATVTADLRGQAVDLKQFRLEEYKVQLARQNQQMVSVVGSGTYDTVAESADLLVTLQANVVNLLQAIPQPDVAMSGGTVELKGHVTQKQKNQTVTGSFVVADLRGKFGKNEFRGFGTTMDLDVAKNDQLIQIRKAAGKLTEGGSAGGIFDISGQYNLDKKSGQITAKLADFNQTGLRAFLEPALADKKLVSVALNGTASAQYDPQGDSTVKADLKVANLVVRDPANQFPAEPLEAKLAVDASLRKQVADVRQFQIGLTPNERAKNELNITGRLDMTQTNAIRGNLKLAAESLDVTRYYDLFAGTNKQATAKAPTRQTAPPQSPPAASGPETEPEAKKLPVADFALDVNIGRLYLRQLEITNLQTKATVQTNRVVARPVQLAINGAPINAAADVDLGVAGYKYDVSFDARKVPIAPLAATAGPEWQGQFSNAVLNASAAVKGAGVTGANLQRNLSGQFDAGSTNLNLLVLKLPVKAMQSRWIKPIIAVLNAIAVVPEIIDNPTSALTSLSGAVLHSGGRSGWADDLLKEPIQIVQARGTIGSGKVNLERADVQSASFLASTHGQIVLAEVLTNSPLNLPVSVLVSRPLAERIKLAQANAGASTDYIKLPDYVTMKGTIGEPKTDLNKTALTGTLLKGVAGLLGGKAGGVLQGVGGLLGGQTTVQPGATSTNSPTANTNSPTVKTNQPATNPPPVLNLLDQLLKPKKK
jgi:hypothetical protein